jgi:hypothetical protein
VAVARDLAGQGWSVVHVDGRRGRRRHLPHGGDRPWRRWNHQPVWPSVTGLVADDIIGQPVLPANMRPGPRLRRTDQGGNRVVPERQRPGQRDPDAGTVRLSRLDPGRGPHRGSATPAPSPPRSLPRAPRSAPPWSSARSTASPLVRATTCWSTSRSTSRQATTSRGAPASSASRPPAPSAPLSRGHHEISPLMRASRCPLGGPGGRGPGGGIDRTVDLRRISPLPSRRTG